MRALQHPAEAGLGAGSTEHDPNAVLQNIEWPLTEHLYAEESKYQKAEKMNYVCDILFKLTHLHELLSMPYFLLTDL